MVAFVVVVAAQQGLASSSHALSRTNLPVEAAFEQAVAATCHKSVVASGGEAVGDFRPFVEDMVLAAGAADSAGFLAAEAEVTVSHNGPTPIDSRVNKNRPPLRLPPKYSGHNF